MVGHFLLSPFLLELRTSILVIKAESLKISRVFVLADNKFDCVLHDIYLVLDISWEKLAPQMSRIMLVGLNKCMFHALDLCQFLIYFQRRTGSASMVKKSFSFLFVLYLNKVNLIHYVPKKVKKN